MTIAIDHESAHNKLRPELKFDLLSFSLQSKCFTFESVLNIPQSRKFASRYRWNSILLRTSTALRINWCQVMQAIIEIVSIRIYIFARERERDEHMKFGKSFVRHMYQGRHFYLFISLSVYTQSERVCEKNKILSRDSNTHKIIHRNINKPDIKNTLTMQIMSLVNNRKILDIALYALHFLIFHSMGINMEYCPFLSISRYPSSS